MAYANENRRKGEEEQPRAGRDATGRIVRVRPYGPAALAEDITALYCKFPFIRVLSIGFSVLGRPIYALRIGEGPFSWQFNASIHANEWITSLLLMRFAEDYARAFVRDGSIGGKDAAALYERRTLWLVPMVNPDGVELAIDGLTGDHPVYEELKRANRGSPNFNRWKANARGVDLNDQFPAHWEEERERRGVAGPSPRDYGGAAPLCEPEAFALAKWTERVDFGAVLALHTQGEEIYWNYRGCEPPEAESWAKKLGEASGYRPVALEGSDAGFKDWFIERFRRPGFTVEAGWGHNPLPLGDFAGIYDDIVRLLTEALDLPGTGA